MDSNKIIKYFISIFLILNLILLSIFVNKNININFEFDKKYPIDFELKPNLDNCYLTIHNFISFNSTMTSNGTDSLQAFYQSNQQKFKTYVYSYTKPYLIELVHNSSKDCLCCP